MKGRVLSFNTGTTEEAAGNRAVGGGRDVWGQLKAKWDKADWPVHVFKTARFRDTKSS